jgi:AcrR family transcriptional regulator
MSRERLSRMAPERRDKLFESAAEEFAAHGYEGASLNRIMGRAGIGKSSLYYYFDDKRDLFRQLVEAVFEHFVREIGGFDYRTLTAETFWPQIEALFIKGVAFSESHPWYIRAGQMFYRVRGQERGGGTTGSLMSMVETWIASLLRHGTTLGVVRSDLPEALLVQSVMALVEVGDRYFLESWAAHDKEGRRTLVDQQMGLLKRVCLPEQWVWRPHGGSN